MQIEIYISIPKKFFFQISSNFIEVFLELFIVNIPNCFVSRIKEKFTLFFSVLYFMINLSKDEHFYNFSELLYRSVSRIRILNLSENNFNKLYKCQVIQDGRFQSTASIKLGRRIFAGGDLLDGNSLPCTHEAI